MSKINIQEDIMSGELSFKEIAAFYKVPVRVVEDAANSLAEVEDLDYDYNSDISDVADYMSHSLFQENY